MIPFLLPGLVILVTLLKDRYKVLWYVVGAWLLVNVLALIWVLGASDGESPPAWLVVLAIALWLGMLCSLMIEPAEDSWWDRNRMDERFSVFFRYLGIAVLIACPLSLAIAYIFEGTIGAVLVMLVFAAVVFKAFLLDQVVRT